MTDIRGNLQLGYTITIDHGSLIGDVSNVDPEHINSGTSPRTDALYADGSGVTEFRAGASSAYWGRGTARASQGSTSCRLQVTFLG